MDMDEESFIKAWNTYKDTSSRRLAEEKGIAPTSAQVAEFAAASAQTSGDEKAFDQILAKAILFPVAACSSWAQFISCSRKYYNQNLKLDFDEI